MAANNDNSGSRLETEIERCRSEGQWDKIPELVRQLSAKLISNGVCVFCLLRERKHSLIVVLYLIYYSILQCGGVCLLFLSQPEYMQEASLIMAKLCYVEGDYREALNQYSRVSLDEMQLVGAPVYRLSTIAEAYATKGK
uniref:Tetratricopeptide repeat protein 7 N-terminal domain-containing protein n=1 Tax=Sinocyclocheilus grahami TaxID=75366 RepID=A0A672K5D7_SINGR